MIHEWNKLALEWLRLKIVKERINKFGLLDKPVTERFLVYVLRFKMEIENIPAVWVSDGFSRQEKSEKEMEEWCIEKYFTALCRIVKIWK